MTITDYGAPGGVAESDKIMHSHGTLCSMVYTVI